MTDKEPPSMERELIVPTSVDMYAPPVTPRLTGKTTSSSADGTDPLSQQVVVVQKYLVAEHIQVTVSAEADEAKRKRVAIVKKIQVNHGHSLFFIINPSFVDNSLLVYFLSLL
jgi:hypothetical protein